MFNRNKVSIDPKGHGSPVTYLIQNRYLADPRFVPISFDSDVAISDPQPGVDYTTEELDDLGRNHERTSKIVQLAEDVAKRHPRTIVFCPSVGSALDCNCLLRAKGISSAVVTANTPSEERRAIINGFRSGGREHMVLFNYGVLTAGFDAPRTRCVIIARPTTSLVLYSQMAGRAMRGPRAGGNSTAEILTVADTNLPGFGSVTDAFTNWEDLWSNN
jgi:superfamily II DNA or RNA helicase